MQILSAEELAAGMAELCPSWSVVDEGKALSRKVVARNFQCALDYVVSLGAAAEEAGHHPDLHLTGYRNVEIKLFTHSLGGLTVNDLIVAAKTDAVPCVYSPKFARENPEMKAGRI